MEEVENTVALMAPTTLTAAITAEKESSAAQMAPITLTAVKTVV
jgi:hypothetical protein